MYTMRALEHEHLNHLNPFILVFFKLLNHNPPKGFKKVGIFPIIGRPPLGG